MSRKARIYSESGVYHVMLRGINRQDIFESEKDYIKFLYEIRRVAFPDDETGKPMKPELVVYAYCLMPNHVHLLVKEQDVKYRTQSSVYLVFMQAISITSTSISDICFRIVLEMRM